jgi:hypothetical protein
MRLFMPPLRLAGVRYGTSAWSSLAPAFAADEQLQHHALPPPSVPASLAPSRSFANDAGRRSDSGVVLLGRRLVSASAIYSPALSSASDSAAAAAAAAAAGGEGAQQVPPSRLRSSSSPSAVLPPASTLRGSGRTPRHVYSPVSPAPQSAAALSLAVTIGPAPDPASSLDRGRLSSASAPLRDASPANTPRNGANPLLAWFQRHTVFGSGSLGPASSRLSLTPPDPPGGGGGAAAADGAAVAALSPLSAVSSMRSPPASTTSSGAYSAARVVDWGSSPHKGRGLELPPFQSPPPSPASVPGASPPVLRSTRPRAPTADLAGIAEESDGASLLDDSFSSHAAAHSRQPSAGEGARAGSVPAGHSQVPTSASATPKHATLPHLFAPPSSSAALSSSRALYPPSPPPVSARSGVPSPFAPNDDGDVASDAMHGGRRGGGGGEGSGGLGMQPPRPDSRPGSSQALLPPTKSSAAMRAHARAASPPLRQPHGSFIPLPSPTAHAQRHSPLALAESSSYSHGGRPLGGNTLGRSALLTHHESASSELSDDAGLAGLLDIAISLSEPSIAAPVGAVIAPVATAGPHRARGNSVSSVSSTGAAAAAVAVASRPAAATPPPAAASVHPSANPSPARSAASPAPVPPPPPHHLKPKPPPPRRSATAASASASGPPATLASAPLPKSPPSQPSFDQSPAPQPQPMQSDVVLSRSPVSPSRPASAGSARPLAAAARAGGDSVFVASPPVTSSRGSLQQQQQQQQLSSLLSSVAASSMSLGRGTGRQLLSQAVRDLQRTSGGTSQLPFLPFAAADASGGGGPTKPRSSSSNIFFSSDDAGPTLVVGRLTSLTPRGSPAAAAATDASPSGGGGVAAAAARRGSRLGLVGSFLHRRTSGSGGWLGGAGAALAGGEGTPPVGAGVRGSPLASLPPSSSAARRISLQAGGAGGEADGHHGAQAQAAAASEAAVPSLQRVVPTALVTYREALASIVRSNPYPGADADDG